MLNYYYRDSIQSFLQKEASTILGEISISDHFDTRNTQNRAWETQVKVLKKVLDGFEGELFFEFSVPRMGRRIDVLLIIQDVIFVIEFKVGEHAYHRYDLDQVWDYALDLKNFHEPSHQAVMIPILVATEAKQSFLEFTTTSHDDNLFNPIRTNEQDLQRVLQSALQFCSDQQLIDGESYSRGRYAPTPTIVEAALSLYNNHTVREITRKDAGVKNLTATTSVISNLISVARKEKKKKICFVTGVPGAGKTLVGLDVATDHLNHQNGDASVYLSGNGPLVSI
ncbi:MAG: DNA/RNA helicase domain-containing protein, partial [Balneolaceae bacterium]